MPKFLSTFQCLECVGCRAQFDTQTPYLLCPKCDGLLDPQYDLTRMKAAAGRIRRRRTHDLWKWREFLPITGDRNLVTLGEGGTPLLAVPRLATYCGVRQLWVKNDAVNPTGSLKDRSVPIAVTKACEFGYTAVSADSTGNKAASVAAYAARAGLRSIVFCNTSTPKEKILQTLAYGAKVIRVEGDYTAVNAFYKALLKSPDLHWYDCGTSNPYRYEGKKTYAYEIAEALDWQPPDRVVHPANGGMSLAKTYKGFCELRALGLIDRVPHMTVVQAEGYDPIVQAARRNTEMVPTAGGPTLAGALAGRDPGDLGLLALRAVRDSAGTGMTVNDQEIAAAVEQLGRDGLFIEPSGAVAIAGLRKLVQQSVIDPEEKVVCVLTGSGFKDMQFFGRVELASPIKPDVDQALASLREL